MNNAFRNKALATRVFWPTLVVAGTVLSGCASTEPVAYSDIAASSRLAPNRDDRSGREPYAYAALTDWRQYRQVILEPVEIYRGADNQFVKISEADKLRLTVYMRQQFAQKLGEVLNVTDQPAPDAIRVKLILTGARTTTAFLGTLSHFDLAGGAYNAVQGARGKEGVLTGSVMYAVEIEDAATGRLLSAYVAKQYPNAMNIKATFGPLGASMAGVRKGADDLARKLSRDGA